jgi:hypothetical protein
MNDHSHTNDHHHHGPNPGLLLLIPLAVVVAKAASHRRAMWGAGWGPGGFDPAGGPTAGGDRDSFRLPPRLEWMLDTWHTRAHQRQAATGTPTESTTETTTA